MENIVEEPTVIYEAVVDEEAVKREQKLQKDREKAARYRLANKEVVKTSQKSYREKTSVKTQKKLLEEMTEEKKVAIEKLTHEKEQLRVEMQEQIDDLVKQKNELKEAMLVLFQAKWN
jgi:hypothetical protein